MRALMIEHDHLSPGGPVADALVRRGYDVTELVVVPPSRFDHPNVECDFPPATTFDLIVPMGAPWSTYDSSRIGGWVANETRLLIEADEAGVPVLGICFGGQLLAQAHGGRVAKAPVHEIGWYTTETDDAGLIEAGPWFEWHYDRWSLPPGAREIARNERASQAFALRRNLAVQFHPELTPDTLQAWLGNGGDSSARAHGVDVEALIAQTKREAPAAAERAHRLVDRFLTHVAAAPRTGT